MAARKFPIILLLMILIESSRYVNGVNNGVESANRAIEFNGAALNKILENYDRKIRPNTYGPATQVQVELKVMSFGPVHENEQNYDLEIFFRQWWNDPAINGAINRSLTMAIDVGKILWKPDTYFVNAIQASFQYVTKETMRVVLQPDGSVYYSSRITLKVSCPMHFSLFPMDKQSCPLVIESYSYTKEEVFYTWHESVGTLRKTKGVEWIATDGPVFKLVNVDSKQKKLSNNSKGSFSQLTVTFHMARRHGYYIWNAYLPSGFLVMMTWVNFWIPASAYPARVTVCVTSFLSTLLVMSNTGNQITRVSYVKAIDYFVMGNAIFVFMSLLEYVVVLHTWLDVSFKFWKRKKTLDLIAKSNETNEGFDHEAERNGNQNDMEGIEMAESSVRQRELPSNDNDNNNLNQHLQKRKRFMNNRSKSNCSTLVTNGLFDNNNIFTMVCSDKDSHGNPCKKCQSNDHLWYEKSGKSHPVDVLSRFLFPLSYAIFVFGYCIFYKMF